jgi:Zn-dependent protease
MPDNIQYCASCGAMLPPQALTCFNCHQLVHAEALEDMAARARIREANHDMLGAARLWRDSLRVLPLDSTQAQAILEHVKALGEAAKTQQAPPPQQNTPQWLKRFGPLGAGIALVLGKLKFLLLGLGQLKTLLSMFVTMGVYWSLYGWKFAVGFVLGIYIHEMGHVWMLRHYGLRASTPMFIPGFGAFISLYDSPANHGQDARIGLAGPLWGAGAALLAVLGYFAGGGPIWLAIAHATVFINLFNLTPVWQLDGGRAFRALAWHERLIILALVGLLWFLTRQGMFIVVFLGAAFRIFWQKDHAPEPDPGAFAQFAALLVLFAALLAWLPTQ